MASSCHEIPLHAGVEENAEWLLADLEPDLPHSDESVFSEETNEAVAAMLNPTNKDENYDFADHDDGEEAGALDEDEVDTARPVVDIGEFESNEYYGIFDIATGVSGSDFNQPMADMDTAPSMTVVAETQVSY